MFTDEDKKTAKALCSNKNFIELLKKVLLEREDKLTPDLVNQKTNVQLGEIVRADTQAEIKIRDRLTILLNLGIPKGQPKVPPK
jgi:hypothetical protein